MNGINSDKEVRISLSLSGEQALTLARVIRQLQWMLSEEGEPPDAVTEEAFLRIVPLLDGLENR